MNGNQRSNSAIKYPQLSIEHLKAKSVKVADVLLPTNVELLNLPERVIQFGTGGFLRSFADFFIDNANRNGRFNGRCVVVQSTNSGRSKMLNEQDGLYTVFVKGIEGGKVINKARVISAFSRMLSAHDEWDAILEVATKPDITLVISNTTEVGIRFDKDDKRTEGSPDAFPAKLTLLLHKRFTHFQGNQEKGWTILPCELIKQNGDELKRCVIAYAGIWDLGNAFIKWVEEANTFCNTLVDRIVPGSPSQKELNELSTTLGYRDEMLINAEPYSLWAIEGDDTLADKLDLSQDNPSVIVDKDISPYRELKIGLLNGGHTLTVPIGFLIGLTTVLDNMEHPLVSSFISRLLKEEIAPSLPVDSQRSKAFVEQVLERWKNPYIDHLLLDITFQSTNKMKARVVPNLLRYYDKFGAVPHFIAFGFAAYLTFMRAVTVKDNKFFGEHNGKPYLINDLESAYFYESWAQADTSSPNTLDSFVQSVLSNEALWGMPLDKLDGLSQSVTKALYAILTTSPEKALEEILDNTLSNS